MDYGMLAAFLAGAFLGAFAAWCAASWMVAAALKPGASNRAKARIGLPAAFPLDK